MNSCSKPVGRKLAMFFALTLGAVSVLAIALPVMLRSPLAEAQSAGELDGLFDKAGEEPTVRWLQGSSVDDAVEFLGSDDFEGSTGRQFASELLAAMGVGSDVRFTRPADFLDDGVELLATLDSHLLTAQSNWRGAIDVRAMAFAMQTRGFATFDVDLCSVIRADLQYMRPADLDYDDCKSWTIETASALRGGDVITIVEHPTMSFYNALVRWISIGVFVVTMAFIALTLFLRKKRMPELGAANLLFSVIAVFVGAGVVTAVAGVFLFGVGSVGDVLVIKEAGWREHTLFVLAPALSTGIPFLASAIVIVRAKPRSVTPDRVTATGGVPYWMVAPSPTPPTPTPQAFRPPSPEQPPQWDPPS